MQKMKESGIEWIGAIPEDWEMPRAKSVFQQRLSKGNEKAILLAATQKYGMYPQNLIEGVVQVKEDTDLQQFKTVHRNDYVISLRSFQGGFEISDYEGVCSPAYQVFFAKKEIDYKFYKYLFKSDGFISKMNALTVGIREGKTIQFKDFSDTMIPMPSVEQQNRIATYLDSKTAAVDDAISKQQALIDKLAAYKQSLITETVTKGLNPDAPMKDSGVEWIGAIPAHWTIKRLKYIVRISDGTHDTPQYVVPSDNSFPLVTSKCISDGCIDVSLANHIGKKDYDEINKRSKVGQFDVIMPMIGTVGNPALVNEVPRFAIKNVALLKTNASYIVGKYVQYLLNSDVFKKQIEYIVRGGVQNFISQDKLKNMQFPVCDDMKMIIDYLDTKCAAIDANIAKRRMMIEKLTQYKKSLIYEAVTGKMEI